MLKTFVLPKLLYPLFVLHNPSRSTINEINKLFYQFLWDNKPKKIARKVIRLDIEKKGLNMVDLKAELNTILYRILDENNHTCSCFIEIVLFHSSDGI